MRTYEVEYLRGVLWFIGYLLDQGYVTLEDSVNDLVEAVRSLIYTLEKKG